MKTPKTIILDHFPQYKIDYDKMTAYKRNGEFLGRVAFEFIEYAEKSSCCNAEIIGEVVTINDYVKRFSAYSYKAYCSKCKKTPPMTKKDLREIKDILLKNKKQ